MKTKDFFTRDEEYARMKAIIVLLAIVFVTGLVTSTYGTEVGRMYLIGIFGSFAVISIGLLYYYRESDEEITEEKTSDGESEEDEGSDE